MPRYDYECAACGTRQEHQLSWSDYVPEHPCVCGAVAARVFDSMPEVCVKGNERPFKLDATCVPIGWQHGNTDVEKQERRYKKLINETKKRAQAVDKQAIKGGIRHIGSVPRELMRMRTNQYGKDYLDPAQQSTAEVKEKLRSDGLLFKN